MTTEKTPKTEPIVALAVQDADPLPVASIQDLRDIGKDIATSGMFGSCTPGRGMVIATTCVQERMSLLEFKRTFHVTDKGDVTMRADRMLAEFQRRGGKCVWTEHSATRAAATFTFRENVDVEIEYTIKEAKDAGFIRPKSAWTTDPAAMLRSRLITRAVRMLCPGAVCGTYTPEEMEDLYGSMPRPEPVTISAEDAAERAAAAVGSTPAEKTVAPAPEASPAPPADKRTPFEDDEVIEGDVTVDYGLCPMKGKLFGVRWDEMEISVLEYAAKVEHPMMEPEHYEAIKTEIAKKGLV
jgi:hypothetical protein